jgi:hypothetical protein
MQVWFADQAGAQAFRDAQQNRGPTCVAVLIIRSCHDAGGRSIPEPSALPRVARTCDRRLDEAY